MFAQHGHVIFVVLSHMIIEKGICQEKGENLDGCLFFATCHGPTWSGLSAVEQVSFIL